MALFDNDYDHSRAFRSFDRRDILGLNLGPQWSEMPVNELERVCCKSSTALFGCDRVGDLIVIDPEGADRAIFLDDVEMWVLPR